MNKQNQKAGETSKTLGKTSASALDASNYLISAHFKKNELY
jgi:hypothetical protein